jgi:hypothetical protein
MPELAERKQKIEKIHENFRPVNTTELAEWKVKMNKFQEHRRQNRDTSLMTSPYKPSYTSKFYEKAKK